MGRFATTVPYYQRYRQPYPRDFFQRAADLMGLEGTQSLVDVGCGPAILALGFAPRVGRVAGVDPEPAMVAAARSAAAEARVELTLYESRIEDLPAGAGPFSVAVIGRALHWMEPRATVAAFDRLLAPGGAVLTCAATTAEKLNPWLAAYHALRDSLKAPEDNADYRRDPAAFFDGSPFALRERFSVRTEQTVSVEILTGRLLSMSTTSPEVLGARAGRLEDAVGEAVGPFLRSDGGLTEVIETLATLFTRHPSP